VGIDLHRRRSVIVRMDEAGETLSTVSIENDPVALALEVAKAGPDPEVVLEATYGWYWAADVLEAAGATVHLAHPLGVAMFTHQRVKNDRRDATNLAQLLRMGQLPEAWIAPPELRELRELVRYRAKLVALRSGLKAQVHAVLAKEGVRVPMTDLFGVGGNRLLDSLALAPAFDARVRSLRDLIEVYDTQVKVFEQACTQRLAGHQGYRAIQAIRGVGRVFGALFVAEIGDVHRFPGPRQLCSWAGLTPRHHESDTTVRRGSITKMACGRAVRRGPVRSGGDHDCVGWPGYSSGSVDVRLCGSAHGWGRDGPDRAGRSWPSACLVETLRRPLGCRVRPGGLHGVALCR